MNNKPKINLTEEDNKVYLRNLFIKLIIEKDYPEIIKRADTLTTRFLKEYVDK